MIHLSNEHKIIQKEIRDFSHTELEPIADEIDTQGEVPYGVLDKLKKLGFLSLIVPEEFEGTAVDITGLCIVLEELSKDCASIGTILAVHNCLVTYPLMRFASKELQDAYLPIIAQGGIGVYVADTGYDMPDHTLQMRNENNESLISGQSDFAFNGKFGKLYVVQLRTDGNPCLCVLREEPGITKNQQKLLGLKSAGITHIEFTDVKVKTDACVLHTDMPSENLAEVHALAHLGFAAVALGIAESSYATALSYSKERKQFGRAICEFPMVQEILVNMHADLESARMLVYDAAQKLDHNTPWIDAALVARLRASETAVSAGNNAIQIYGGYGYTKEYPVERYFRDAKSLQVLIDTPDSIYGKIAKEMLV
jgi:alkylation response protein AidB-like acyl-CoA dehydrogenase